jgi:hypothetical protein
MGGWKISGRSKEFMFLYLRVADNVEKSRGAYLAMRWVRISGLLASEYVILVVVYMNTRRNWKLSSEMKFIG